jgi:cation diffusion facilitator family transporter
MNDAKSARDQRMLMFSIWASAGFAVLSSIWGILSGSSMIVFDGVYSFVSIGLSVLAVLALRFSGRGADERFPWGRDAAEPLVVVIKAATLGALCAYAAVGGILDIVNGGRQVAVGSAVVYAAVATLGGLTVGLVLRRATRDGSDLVRAEAAEWLGDALLSVGVLVGFLVAYALVAADRRLGGLCRPRDGHARVAGILVGPDQADRLRPTRDLVDGPGGGGDGPAPRLRPHYSGAVRVN